MIRVFLISIVLFFIVNLSFAQGNLTGRVYENKTRIPIAGVSVQNLKSNVFAVTDKNGLFSIRAHVGDLITFSSFAYETDTLYVKDLGSTEIFNCSAACCKDFSTQGRVGDAGSNSPKMPMRTASATSSL